MPKKRKQNKYDATQEKRFLKVFGDVFIMPIFRITQTLASDRPHGFHTYRRNLVVDIIALTLLLIFLIYLGGRHFLLIRLYIFWYIAGGIVAILSVALIIRLLRNRIRRKYTSSGIEDNLRAALQIMDSTSNWYLDENAANQELISCLRSQNINAVYGYKLGNCRIADGRVGDILIEGKLSPQTQEIDRLLGQLGDYISYGKVNVVIYGHLSDRARKRILKEINKRYPDKAFLTYLNNPKRQRAITQS